MESAPSKGLSLTRRCRDPSTEEKGFDSIAIQISRGTDDTLLVIRNSGQVIVGNGSDDAKTQWSKTAKFNGQGPGLQ